MVDEVVAALADYQPHGMIAQQLFPVVPVARASGEYYMWPSLGGTGLTCYTTEEYAWTTESTSLPHLHRAQDFMLLDQELRVAALATDSARYPADHVVTLSGTCQWSYDPGNIEGDMQRGRGAIYEAIGRLPNTIVIPRKVGRAMLGDSTDGLPAEMWDMRVLEPGVLRLTTGDDGGLVEDLWGKHVLLAYVAPEPALDGMTLGLIFRARSWQVHDEPERKVRVSLVETEVLIAPACGYLIRNAVA